LELSQFGSPGQYSSGTWSHNSKPPVKEEIDKSPLPLQQVNEKTLDALASLNVALEDQP